MVSQAEIDAIRTVEDDPTNWIPDHCKIEDKAGNLVDLVFNHAQNIIEGVKRRVRDSGKPVRLIILKARQEGVTTYELACQYQRSNVKTNHHALLAAHKAESSEEIFLKVKLFREHDPLPKPTDYSSRRELVYRSPYSSRLRVATAGDADLGRSGTIQDLHCSEVAFWPDARKSLAAVLQCIPDPEINPDTVVVMESTANGLGGEFYNHWCNSKPAFDSPFMTLPKGTGESSDYLAIFLPWHIFPDYRAKVPVGFSRTQEEEQLVETYSLDDGQLQWRRRTISDKCGGDEDMFKQEYPSNDREAFLATGRPYFPQTQLDWLLGQCVDEPLKRGIFNPDGAFMAQDEGWEIYELPISGMMYALGGDPAEGLDPEETHDPEKTDRSIADIVRWLPGGQVKIVAKLRCRWHEDVFAGQVNLAGRYYNDALVGTEINNKCGGAVLVELKRANYPNIFITRKYDKRADKWLEKLGWTTDKFNRPMMLNDLRILVRGGEDDGIPRIDIPSVDTVNELFGFVYGTDGKPCARPGEHDDEVLGLSIAVQMLQSMGSPHTVAPRMPKKRSEMREEEYTTGLATVGAIDTFDDMIEDDE